MGGGMMDGTMPMHGWGMLWMAFVAVALVALIVLVIRSIKRT